MPTSDALRAILERLRHAREGLGLTASDLEERLILGPGWLDRIESGETALSIDLLLAVLHQLGVDPAEFFGAIELPATAAEIARDIYAVPDETDLRIHFVYADHDAVYVLPGATLEAFESVLSVLRGGLAQLTVSDDSGPADAIKSSAVARAYLRAVELWPHANPSDLWWFLLYRAYCDRFNHPAKYARLDLVQSWKRTGGWALEQVLVRHYGAHLKSRGINLVIGPGERKAALVAQLDVRDRLESDKIDVLLSADVGQGAEVCFGVIHVKASFAERRTDDVPMSRALIEAGYTSPLWTMDCKSVPAAAPVNRGELGQPYGEPDRRSAKRRDIEDDGYFSACFSYNRNALPPEKLTILCGSRLG
jgi:transcriptional regulator with XRE-family HTH domain